MACNCATNEQLEELYRQFGQQVKLPKGATLKHRVKNYLTQIGVSILLIILFPYLLCYVIYIGFFGDSRISLSEFFGFRKKIVKEIE